MEPKQCIVALVIVGILIPSGAFALKRAPFTDPTQLQPIPTNVRPNVSGNVNATLAPAQYVEAVPQEPQNVGTDPATVPSATQTHEDRGGFPWLILLGILVVLATITGLFLHRRGK